MSSCRILPLVQGLPHTRLSVWFYVFPSICTVLEDKIQASGVHDK